EERQVPLPVDLEDPPGGPGVHRRVDVRKGPLIGGKLSIGVLRPLPTDEDELVLREGRVDPGQRIAVEGQVPRGEPWVFPVVRHGDDIRQRQMSPRGIATRMLRREQTRWGWRIGGVALEPLLDVVAV